MATKKINVASEEKPPAGHGANQPNNGATININTTNPSQHGNDKSETERRTDTSNDTTTEQSETTTKPKPPRYTEPVTHDLPGAREKVAYSAIAATLFARFDPNDPREQPAEHIEFIDRRLSKHGFI